MRAFLYLALIVMLVVTPLRSTCQTEPLSQIADQLASKVRDTRKHYMFPKVVINTFVVQPEGVSQLTQHLSDKLSKLLADKLNPGAVISRAAYLDALTRHSLSPEDFEDPDIAMWIAKGLGANIVIFGSVVPSADQLSLTLSAIRVSDRKNLFSLLSQTTFTDEWKELLGKPLELGSRQQLAVNCSASTNEDSVDAFKSAGVSYPKCVNCPPPIYTNEARIAHFEGLIRVKAIVSEKGDLNPVRVLDPAPPSLIVETLSTLEHWKMDPAKRDGVPVPVCVVVENTFRLY